MIDNEKIKLAIEKAKSAAAEHSEHKDQVFTAVLTAELLSAQEQTIIKPAISKKTLSFQELLNEKKPKNEVQKTLLFGYYLEMVTGKSEFTTNDIEDCYRNAKEPKPPNVSDKIKLNIQHGLMMQVGKMESSLTYSLTNTGIKAVELGYVD